MLAVLTRCAEKAGEGLLPLQSAAGHDERFHDHATASEVRI